MASMVESSTAWPAPVLPSSQPLPLWLKGQKALVKRSFPVTREDMTKLLKMREEVHATLYDIVESKDREKMEAQFIRWGNNPAANRSEEYRQYATERTDNTKKFVLELDGTLTEGQRARVLKKMQTVIDGLSRLSRRDPTRTHRGTLRAVSDNPRCRSFRESRRARNPYGT